MKTILKGIFLCLLCLVLFVEAVRLRHKPAAEAPQPSTGPALSASPTTLSAGQIAADQADMKAAIEKVRQIVNRPAPSVPRTEGMNIGWYGDAWFHPGALTPDYNKVDVRKTQDLSNYSKFAYVTSNMTASRAYPGSALEFNPMTKIFYTDRSVPKRKLTEAEMIEINRLYRIIGKCRDELKVTGAP